jgi:hypothetical protein
MLSSDQSADGPERVGGCYRVEAALGRGGMARVYRVLDERSGQRLALKQLVAEGDQRAALRSMFEHEYHTLAQLAHPCIVRVLDYGLDAVSPYYTMELLEGADAREANRNQALSVHQICVVLRDAASALALIHSRRMVHRDMSPRNLWCTPDGHAKLIDFGTLVAMGVQTHIVGTPPFVPPEAVYMQPLDARSDLYSLGALAYFLLTQRNAYPARSLADLRSMWQRRPKRPDELRPELPRALADLVMALLSLDARGRPASAAEVYERLTAIAELPVGDERQFAQAFLSSPKLVGRDDVMGLLRKRLLRAVRGRGSTGAVVAGAGLGRSRMLASLVLEAKLMGAAVIGVDATAVGSGPFALAGTIAERLLEALPMTAAQAVELGPVLGHVSPALRRAFGEPDLVELSPLEHSRKLSSALVRLIEGATQEQRLVIAVDDVHRADSASLGVLGRLSVLASERRLLLVTSCDQAAVEGAPPALEQLLEPSRRIELAPLRAEHTLELLGSLFGAVPGLEETASWLHELSSGSPQACMQYAQYLVDHDLAKYEGGRWRLPEHLREQALPATLGAVLEGRLAALSGDARALALGLALARDETCSAWQPETHVRVEDFPKLLQNADAARAFSALDELLRAGAVQQRDSYYVLAQRAMVDALLRVTDERARELSLTRLANIFEHGAYQGRMMTVRHLQRAGEQQRACELLLEQAAGRFGSGVMDWSTMRVSVNAECAQNALAHLQTVGGTPKEAILLRRLLLLTCSVYDWSLARFGDAQIAQLRADCGLVHWESTDPALSGLGRVLECLKLAQQEYEQKPELERGFSPLEAVRELASCSMTLSGSYVNAHQVARVRELPAVLAPLRPLSAAIPIIADLCELAVDRVTGREVGARMLEGANRLLASNEISSVLRQGGSAIFVHIQAVEDARRGRARTLELMDRLASGTAIGEDMFLVLHGRWLGHAFRGQSAAAQPFRKQLEVITEDDVWRRKATLFVEAQLHALTGDLLNLTRVSEAITELAAKFEGWRPWSAWTRAEIHRLRGELPAAEIELEHALAQAAPGEHRAWVLAAPAQAELRLLSGDAAGAVSKAEMILQTVSALSLDLSAAIAAERVRALALSSQGDHSAARASLEAAFELARTLDYDGLPLAVLYEAQAKLAFAAGERREGAAALERLHGMLEHADAPSLVHRYEALRGESPLDLALPSLRPEAPASRTVIGESTAIFTEVQTRLNTHNERDARARQALELLLEDSGATSGHLFLFDAGGLFPAVSHRQGHASETLLALAQQYVQADIGESMTAAVTVADLASAGTTVPTVLVDGDSRLAPILLCDYASGQAMLSGLALLTIGTSLRMPRTELIRAISRCLQAAGDSLAVAME